MRTKTVSHQEIQWRVEKLKTKNSQTNVFLNYTLGSVPFGDQIQTLISFCIEMMRI